MGTVQDVINRARIRFRDTQKTLHTDDELVVLLSGYQKTPHTWLVQIQSNLIVTNKEQVTEADTREYTVNWYFAAITQAYIAGETQPLVQCAKEDALNYENADTGQPIKFYLLPGRVIGFLPTPDTAYTVKFYNDGQPAAITIDDDLPFDGVFNQWFEDRLVLDVKGINERDIQYAGLEVEISWNQSQIEAYRRGVKRQRQAVPDMFTVEGL